MAFDPTQFATPVKTNFDPNQFAKPVQSENVDPRIALNSHYSSQPSQSSGFVHNTDSFLQRPGNGILPYDTINEKLKPNDVGDKTSGVAKDTIGNQAKSVAKLGVGVLHFLDPVANAKTVGDYAKGSLDYGKDINAQAQSEQGVKDYIPKLQEAIAKNKATGKDTTNLERLLKEAGASPKPDLNPSIAKELPKAAYESLTPGFIKQGVSAAKNATPEQLQANTGHNDAAGRVLEGVHAATQSIAEDPQQLTPYALMGKDYIEKNLPGVDNAISKTGQLVTKPVAAVGNTTLQAAKWLANFATSQATGMSKNTIKTILDNPDQFSSEQAQLHSREGIGQQVHETLNNRLHELSETGKGYEEIKKAGGNIDFSNPPIDPKTGRPALSGYEVLKNYGIDIDENGKIVKTAETVPMKSGDVTALQDFIDQYGNNDTMSNNAFLNARKGLSNLSEYDASKSDISNKISKELRYNMDLVGKDQIPGLSDLDAQYAPEVKLLNQIKKDLLNPDGSFKDNALSKIANVTGKGKENLLGRLQQIDPDLAQKVTVLKAVEDIQNASSQKVGTYARASLGAVGITTGNIPTIIAAVLSTPELATQVLRGFAKLQGVRSSVANGIIKAFNTDISDLNLGLTIKDAKKTNDVDLNKMYDYENKGTNYTGANADKITASDSMPRISESNAVLPIVKKSSVPMEGSNEAIIEKMGGWNPGDKVIFDTALMHGDAKTVRAMLPVVPKEYQVRFVKNISKLLK